MNIATVIMKTGSRHGGLERDFDNFAKKLTEKGHTVHIFTGSWEKEIKGINYHRIHFAKFPAFMKQYSFAKKAQKTIENTSFDLIISSGKTLKHDILRNIDLRQEVRKQNRKSYDNKIIRTIRFILDAVSLKEKLILYVEKKSFTNPKDLLIIANSNLAKKHILKRYKVPKDKIQVIYNGVDTSVFNPKNRINYKEKIRDRYCIGNNKLIGFVANNFRLKGLNCLLKAVALLEKTEWRLLIIGRGNVKKYANIAQKLEINDNLIFTGIIDHTEQYYGAMDILVHPTYYDPFSNVVLEAMSSGIPVITTVFNGASEIITPGKEGFILSDPKDYSLLAAKISRLFDNNIRKSMGTNARILAEKYTLDKNINEAHHVFEYLSDFKNK